MAWNTDFICAILLCIYMDEIISRRKRSNIHWNVVMLIFWIPTGPEVVVMTAFLWSNRWRKCCQHDAFSIPMFVVILVTVITVIYLSNGDGGDHKLLCPGITRLPKINGWYMWCLFYSIFCEIQLDKFPVLYGKSGGNEEIFTYWWRMHTLGNVCEILGKCPLLFFTESKWLDVCLTWKKGTYTTCRSFTTTIWRPLSIMCVHINHSICAHSFYGWKISLYV